MSLETLLEAARYVEQQEELRAKQQQRTTFRIMSPLPSAPTYTHLSPPHSSPLPLLPSPHSSPLHRTSPIQTVHSSPLPSPAILQVTPSLPPPPPTLSPPTLTQQSLPLPLPQQSLQPIVTHIQSIVTTPTPKLISSMPTMQTLQTKIEPIVVVTSPQPVTDPLKPPLPTVTIQQPPQSVSLTNGFEKPVAPLLLDENHDKKRGPVTSVIRSGTREVHNKLEKNRRAHLKECFELLKKQLPPQQDEKKSSNLSILHSALRYIQVLKKKERENEHEMERLAREKISAQQRLAALKKELGSQWDNVDFNSLLPEHHIGASAITPSVTIKEERNSDTDEARVANTTTLQPTQLSVHLPISHQVGYPVSQGLVVGLHKVALVSKSLPLVSSPVTHIIAAPPQLNGKVVPLVNAQYLMKPVVVVSSPSAGGTALSPRPS